MTCVECGNRNVQRHSPDKPQSSADNYATINVERQGQEPQYDVIQHDQPHTQR